MRARHVIAWPWWLWLIWFCFGLVVTFVALGVMVVGALAIPVRHLGRRRSPVTRTPSRPETSSLLAHACSTAGTRSMAAVPGTSSKTRTALTPTIPTGLAKRIAKSQSTHNPRRPRVVSAAEPG